MACCSVSSTEFAGSFTFWLNIDIYRIEIASVLRSWWFLLQLLLYLLCSFEILWYQVVNQSCCWGNRMPAITKFRIGVYTLRTTMSRPLTRCDSDGTRRWCKGQRKVFTWYHQSRHRRQHDVLGHHEHERSWAPRLLFQASGIDLAWNVFIDSSSSPRLVA